MLRNTVVISISLPLKILAILKQISQKSAKTGREKSWKEIFSWGRKTKEKLNIRSEEDIVKLIND